MPISLIYPMLLQCHLRPIRFLFFIYSHHRYRHYTESLTFLPRSASQTDNHIHHRRTLASSETAIVRPANCAEEKPRNYKRVQGISASYSHKSIQHPPLAFSNLVYESDFTSMPEKVNFSRIVVEVKSSVDLSPRTMGSPELAGCPSENPANTSSFQLGNFLEVHSPAAGTLTSVHIGLNDDNAFGYDGIDGFISNSMSQDPCKRSISKAKITLESHKEACCYTHPPEDALPILVDMKKDSEQENGIHMVNEEEFPSRDVHAVPLAICGPVSKSSSRKTQGVNESSKPHDVCMNMSSNVFSAAAQLQGATSPNQLGKRNLSSTEMYHTQSRSDAKKVTGSGNSNQSQPSRKITPFDICESFLGACSAPKTKEVLVKKRVKDGAREILRPGMVLLRNYISLDDQIRIIRSCRHLGLGEGGFYQPRFDSGGKLHLQMMCLGLDWDPRTKKYGDMRQLDGAKPPAIPDIIISLTKNAIDNAHDLIKADLCDGNPADILPHMHPNICIVNFYNTSGRLGLHQDRDESRESLQKRLPVVSISLGDSALFLYGDQRGIDKADKVLLESGDVLIFGGSSRHIFHGVNSIVPDSAPAALRQATNLRPGRLNLTLREF